MYIFTYLHLKSNFFNDNLINLNKKKFMTFILQTLENISITNLILIFLYLKSYFLNDNLFN